MPATAGAASKPAVLSCPRGFIGPSRTRTIGNGPKVLLNATSACSGARCFFIAMILVCLSLLTTVVDDEMYDDVGNLSAILQTLQSSNAALKPLSQQASHEGVSHEEARHVPRHTRNATSNDVVVTAYFKSQRYDQATVAYVVTITDCGLEGSVRFPVTEGAAVLRQSIQSVSQRGSGRYQFQTIAIYHPNASACVHPTMSELGYDQLIERETPVRVKDIQGDFLRERIQTNGCCGEKELIKFEAFTLTEFDLVVLLDLDVLILQPLDELFDFILFNQPLPPGHIMPGQESTIASSSGNLRMLYTIDYAMVDPRRRLKPVQGGFLLLRPNRTVYDEIVRIVRLGDYRDRGGWGGKTGKFWGGMTFQGLIPYYFGVLNPGHSIELNRCIYNNMASGPRTGETVNNIAQGTCYTQEKECEDCRARSIDSVVATHLTVCQKPWLCLVRDPGRIQQRLCGEFHHAWYQQRSVLEQSWGRSGFGPSTWSRERFFGYCMHAGSRGYVPIAKPYGASEAAYLVAEF